MATKIEALWRQVSKTFIRKQCGSLYFEQENLSVLKRQVDAITCEDVALNASLAERVFEPESRSTPVTYIDICSGPNATLEMFVLHPGENIPLHDHPYMIGILKVIAGTIKVDSYTVVSEESRTDSGTVLLAKKQTDIIGANEAACVLTPSERNLHAIHSVGGLAAFLDILSPPYYCNIPGCSPNPCNFYAEAGTIDGPSRGEKLVRLVEIPVPPQYRCDTVPYKGPPISLNKNSESVS